VLKREKDSAALTAEGSAANKTASKTILAQFFIGFCRFR
jgi:hypothetical protein